MWKTVLESGKSFCPQIHYGSQITSEPHNNTGLVSKEIQIHELFLDAFNLKTVDKLRFQATQVYNLEQIVQVCNQK